MLGVPLIIPLAWTWMAWPAWLAAVRLAARPGRRGSLIAAVGLAAWDLFLDPQMVAEGYWRWRRSDARAARRARASRSATISAGSGFALVLMAALSYAAGPAAEPSPADDLPMIVLWFWTYASSVLAHAVFLDLPASAAWGGVVMGAVVIPLAVRLARSRDRVPA